MGLLLAEQLWAASHLVGGQLRATPDTETYTRDPLPANSDDVGRAFRLIHGIPLLSAGYRTMTAMVEGSCVYRGITNGRFRRISTVAKSCPEASRRYPITALAGTGFGSTPRR